MKKLTFILSCCALTLSATAASAAGVYVGGNIGFAVPPSLEATRAGDFTRDIDYDTGWALNGEVGYDFDYFRLEAEIGYQHNNSGDTDWWISRFGDLKVMTYMANGYYDFKNSTPWTPFLGAGIGWANVKVDDIRTFGFFENSVDDTVFAYQFMAGVSYTISKNLALDLSYRYVATDDPTFDDNIFGRPIDFEFSSHNFLLGARYTF